MIKKFLYAFTLFLFALLVRADNIVDEIVARVDDAIITRSDYEKAKQADQSELQQQFPGDWQSRWDQRQKEVLRGLIDRQLLLDKGKELGITGETETVKRLDKMRKEMNLPSMDALEEEARKQGISYEDFKEQIRTGVVAEQVIAQEVGSKLRISAEEAQDWYKKHQKELEGQEEVSLSEIMVAIPAPKPAEKKDEANPDPAQAQAEDPAKVAEAESKAKGLLEQLQKGAKFEDLAKQNSDGPTAAQGGVLGNFKRGELAKEFEDKTFSLKPGEYTDLIRTRQGFIILKVNGHRAAGVPPFNDVKNQIEQTIYSQRLEPAARAYLTKLREQAYIEIKDGYVDAGASPNQNNKPVMMAAAGTAPATSKQAHPKKKKKFLVF
ncbi:MAG TPA: peptidylprolyl isomerase [Candidatus Angelobacter sp.]|nr:peptidylprolyl isomerase [Candidatus Angelobacter sp.]